MAYGLLKRILDHCKDKGWGGVISDPFGGVGSTGILGAYDGYQVICIELEAKFVKLAEQNFELHRRAFEEFGCPYPVIIQGDSRKLCELVESADLILSSPPFVESMQSNDAEFHAKWCKQHGRDVTKPNYKGKIDGYGQTPGQLGAMKPGKVDMVISSPPYADGVIRERSGVLEEPRLKKKKLSENKYGLTKTGHPFGGYGQTVGNLGNLKAGDVSLILSSPPYEGSLASDTRKTLHKLWQGKQEDGTNRGGKLRNVDYGKSQGQLGQEQGNTFWEAAKTILEQCHKILRPGGHAIWVVKSFVRKGKIVDFPGDWQRLCESVGFKTVCIHNAMLVKETKHNTLFGDTEVKLTEKKSFFRRLCESKGSPRIDFEVVLCMEKPKAALFPTVKEKP